MSNEVNEIAGSMTDDEVDNGFDDKETLLELQRRIAEVSNGGVVEACKKADWLPINISMILLGLLLIWSLV